MRTFSVDCSELYLTSLWCSKFSKRRVDTGVYNAFVGRAKIIVINSDQCEV